MLKPEPFLRWAGGKRWLAKDLSSLVASRLQDGGTYFEPFLGAGAVFFAVQPQKALLSDLNKDLIMTFREVARHPLELIKRLSKIPASKKRYYLVRDWNPTSRIDLATRFIYLNRNCYGGIYRENKMGYFNVPYGGGSRNHYGLCKNGVILQASLQLSRAGVHLRVCDFEESLKSARKGDVIYCDPTYREVTRRQFDRYGRILFTWKDQERLASLAREISKKGVVIILSNSTYNGIRELYGGAGVIKVERSKGLGTTAHNGVEYLFILDPLQKWDMWGKIGPIETPKIAVR